MKRTAIVSSIAAATVLASCTPALADPPYVSRADAELQREITDDSYRPSWLNHDPLPESYGYADAILGITFVVGMVLLW